MWQICHRNSARSSSITDATTINCDNFSFHMQDKSLISFGLCQNNQQFFTCRINPHAFKLETPKLLGIHLTSIVRSISGEFMFTPPESTWLHMAHTECTIATTTEHTWHIKNTSNTTSKAIQIKENKQEMQLWKVCAMFSAHFYNFLVAFQILCFLAQ